ncbi:tRNA splicing 2' phosphotransferase 1 [Talaromyces stipitatus ATCC 10500]|uniref:2'-phosphotransferase n=1 Tax=Talaromyces stipitatus (strain ATCC 10500 / CBS 375.48 / QM 6759 / NRRL 1006) TaxID=441959 RepID=B8M5Z8_TALSN|nr:tRNA splicing 2' phosphotransferase 1 [Talaromyces stipitatus ATCC 10500]EED20125.1 tRNA splicing 2' phosphotransferase 1 [Talaromyces stipitatus ATCC 10500]
MSRRGGGRAMPREVVLSKALSHLLRHSAEKENLKISKEGYVNVADLLETRKVKSLKVTLPEIIQAVASSDKQRFSLFYISPATIESGNQESQEQQEAVVATAASEEKQKNATAHALSVKDNDPSHFLIRATQGHSMKSVDTTLFLEKLSLDDTKEDGAASNLPDTVVHGTYHGAWPLILASGGLRSMSRLQVHFATGPTMDEVYPNGRDAPIALLDPRSKATVISGMRSDAEILIYINLRRALEAGCPFYRSENGVILSEGMNLGDSGEGKIVPIEFFDLVIERKTGLGVLWEDGSVVQELPSHLAEKRNPKATRGGGRGRGRGMGQP